jgi:hypothetical protein
LQLAVSLQPTDRVADRYTHRYTQTNLLFLRSGFKTLLP